ncbi:MAG: adenylate/guanylate cyclase domain-containing protein [Actinomycetota bacterium]
MDVPRTRFARSGDYHIAYQVFGDGPMDLLVCGSWQSNVEGRWEVPRMAKFLRRLGSFARVITFDKRGVGLSDPVPLHNLPSLEDWMDDVRAVLDDLGSKRTAIYGVADGGVMAMLFAATYPERTAALLLEHCYAKVQQAPDYPWGVPASLLEQTPELIRRLWINGQMLSLVAPGLAQDEVLREEFARYCRSSASPGAAAAMVDMLRHVDIRYVLPSISVPTLVMHERDAHFYKVEFGRYLAENIPRARYVELPGADVSWFGDQEAILAEMEEFMTGVRPAPSHDRVLATVMFTDIVESTRLAAEWGDARWRNFLERHRDLSRRQLGIHRGREVQMLGDGLFATFDGPARAIRCASAIQEGSRSLGIDVRSGLHTGECELMGEDVGGIAVHIGARVVSLAEPGEVLVSSTVKDLVVGSGLNFDDRGEHSLKGVPGEWRLFAVRN